MKFGQVVPSIDTSAQLYQFSDPDARKVSISQNCPKRGSNFWNFYAANSREAQNEGVFENDIRDELPLHHVRGTTNNGSI